jgi:SAM-dependent methyltransferase
MHDTALEIGKKFFETYTKEKTSLKIIDVGAQDVNGSLRSVAPQNNDFIGVDFVAGKGVDVILTDPYKLPFDDESIDVIVCSSCFEHSEFFWILFIEMQRVLKANGLLYINVPSNGNFHRHPVDCWRFYPDSGKALQNWARFSGYQTTLIESFISEQKNDIWNDFVAVYVKDLQYVDQFPNRIQNNYTNFKNGLSYPNSDFSHYSIKSEDQRRPFYKRIKKRLYKLSLKLKRIYNKISFK